MTDATVPDVQPVSPRAVTMEDVQRLVGALTLEVDHLRRENAALRQQLASTNGSPPTG